MPKSMIIRHLIGFKCFAPYANLRSTCPGFQYHGLPLQLENNTEKLFPSFSLHSPDSLTAENAGYLLASAPELAKHFHGSTSHKKKFSYTEQKYKKDIQQ
jgi:hypothetical protein